MPTSHNTFLDQAYADLATAQGYLAQDQQILAGYSEQLGVSNDIPKPGMSMASVLALAVAAGALLWLAAK